MLTVSLIKDLSESVILFFIAEHIFFHKLITNLNNIQDVKKSNLTKIGLNNLINKIVFIYFADIAIPNPSIIAIIEDPP